MTPIMIPTLLFWENKNTWYGSKGLARFYIKTATAEQEDGQSVQMLEIELWKGPLMKELSEIIATASFPVSEAGLEETVAWLEERATILNAEKNPSER